MDMKFIFGGRLTVTDTVTKACVWPTCEAFMARIKPQLFQTSPCRNSAQLTSVLHEHLEDIVHGVGGLAGGGRQGGLGLGSTGSPGERESGLRGLGLPG